MARKKSGAKSASQKDDVADYRHDEATRKNIPPAKIAAEGKVPVRPRTQYSYHPPPAAGVAV